MHSAFQRPTLQPHHGFQAATNLHVPQTTVLGGKPPAGHHRPFLWQGGRCAPAPEGDPPSPAPVPAVLPKRRGASGAGSVLALSHLPARLQVDRNYPARASPHKQTIPQFCLRPGGEGEMKVFRRELQTLPDRAPGRLTQPPLRSANSAP